MINEEIKIKLQYTTERQSAREDALRDILHQLLLREERDSDKVISGNYGNDCFYYFEFDKTIKEETHVK